LKFIVLVIENNNKCAYNEDAIRKNDMN
jgi:hypothetical protein